MKREVVFYTTSGGKCPIQDFLDCLPDKVFQKIAWVLKLLTELDKIPPTYFKKLAGTDNIWECRISFGANIYRLLCFLHNGSIIVLTNGFIKKSQKTPIDEIVKAEEYRNDYIRRMK
jgi:phage-related protein